MNTHNTPMNVSQEVTSDDKLLSLLCHFSLFLGGIILPIIIWATQKDKSKFVRFHSLQAIFFHIAFVAIIVAFIFLMAVILIGSGLGMGIFSDDYEMRNNRMPVIMIVMMIVIYGGIFVLIFGGMAYAIYLGIKSYKGDLVKIPVIGNIIYRKVYG